MENEEAIYDFKYEYLPQLYYIPLQACELERQQRNLDQRGRKTAGMLLKRVWTRLTLQIGESNLEVMADKAELIQTMILEGRKSRGSRGGGRQFDGKG